VINKRTTMGGEKCFHGLGIFVAFVNMEWNTEKLDLTKVVQAKVFLILTMEKSGLEDTTGLVNNNQVICWVNMIVHNNY
jgi:lipoate-protein ligase B